MLDQDFSSGHHVQVRMDASSDKSKARRKTFFDLPGEIRNIIYKYAFFTSRKAFWAMRVTDTYIYLDAGDSDIDVVRGYRALNPPVYTSGAVNQQMRQETRSMLLAKLGAVMLDEYVYQHDTMHRIFALNDEPNMAASRLGPCPNSTRDLSASTGLHKMFSVLPLCRSLYDIWIEVQASHFFQTDTDALKTFLASDVPLENACLEAFATAITSLPHLKIVEISIHADKPCCNNLSHDPEQRFFQFASSGMREAKIHRAIKDRLQVGQVTVDVHTVRTSYFPVGGPYLATSAERTELLRKGDAIMNYEAWLRWVESGGMDC